MRTPRVGKGGYGKTDNFFFTCGCFNEEGKELGTTIDLGKPCWPTSPTTTGMLTGRWIGEVISYGDGSFWC